MSSTVPYIGSKISLVSNSDIRYEGILYTINTQESTIALQSVRCCGTEGRKVPEIPPSSEIYDFIIFRGQDIKDLTVLESANPALSAQLNDPAIMSVNQRPAGAAAASKSSSGGKGAAAADKGGSNTGGYGGVKGSSSGSAYGGGKGSNSQSNNGGNWSGGWSGGWNKPDSRSNDRSYRSGGYGGWDSGAGYGRGSGGKGKAAEAPKGSKSAGKGKDKGGGKGEGKSGKATDKGKAKEGKGEKGKGSSKGGKANEASASGRRGGGGGAGGDSSGGAPVGELIPSSNDAEKSKYAEDYDYESENKKFEGAKKGVEGEEVDDKLKPLSGYDSKTSFFDNISCEATERAGDAERPKVDRNTARQNDRETFGDTRRPPRPTGGRRGKGGRRGAPRGYRS